MDTTTMSIESCREDLDIGLYALEDRDEVEYYDVLADAEEDGRPWFSFEEFQAKKARTAFCTASTIPAPANQDDDDCIPF